MAALPSVYLAKVVNGADPSRKRRLLVKGTSAMRGGPLWAEACVQNRSQASPPIGSTVLIMFEERDATRPVLIGTHQ